MQVPEVQQVMMQWSCSSRSTRSMQNVHVEGVEVVDHTYAMNAV